MKSDFFIHTSARSGKLPVLRLMFFHHAGGSAQWYARLTDQLPDTWDSVCCDLPGRRLSIGDGCLTRFEDACQHLIDVIRPFDDVPFVLFGHSLGSALAYGVSHHPHVRNHPHFLGIVASGRVPNHLWKRYHPEALSRMEDDELIAAIVKMGGFEPTLLKSAAVKEYFLKLLRSDLRIVENFDGPFPERSSPTDILPIFGRDDPCTSEKGMQEWVRLSRTPIEPVSLSGHHFFIEQEMAEINRLIERNFLRSRANNRIEGMIFA